MASTSVPPVEEKPKEAAAAVCAVGYSSEAKRHTCPFTDAPLFDADGSRWCPFHLPMVTGKGEKTPKATWTPADVQKFFHAPLNNQIHHVPEGARADATPKAINLSFAHVPDMMIFRAAVLVAARFDHAEFHGSTFFQMDFASCSFRGARFRDRADFRGSTFHEDASLPNVQFDNIVQFMGVEFKKDVYLRRASAAQTIDFTDATFGGEVNLDQASFQGDASFCATVNSERMPIPSLNARAAKFGAEARFTNRNLLGATDFAGADFAIAPDFHGCALHQATYFPSIGAFKDTSSPRAASRYRTLYQAMGDVRAHDEEAMFYALMQRTIRRKLGSWDPVRIVSWVYDVGSDYGQSITRPLAALAGTQLVFLVIFLVMGWCHGGLNSTGASFGFCFQQLFRPLAVWTDDASKWPRANIADIRSPWPFILGTTQTLVSALCLYFLALGTRWRFRRW